MGKDTKYAICVGRQLGSGGGEIAKYLAEQLNFKFLDKELLYAAAAKSGYSTEMFEKNDEERSDLHSFITTFIPFVGGADFYGNHVDEDSLFRILSDTIHTLVKEENCVIVGRCAEYILREERDNMVSIFITADEEERIARLCELQNISKHAAHKLISTNDKRRAAFHDFYSTRQWGKASTYHLCINQSRLGMEATKEFLLQYVKKAFSLE